MLPDGHQFARLRNDAKGVPIIQKEVYVVSKLRKDLELGTWRSSENKSGML